MQRTSLLVDVTHKLFSLFVGGRVQRRVKRVCALHPREKNRDSWPNTHNVDFSDALELATLEQKPTVTTNLFLGNSEPNFFEWTKRISKFSTIVRILAYVKRLIFNAKSVVNKQNESLLNGNLKEEELTKSELDILLFIQNDSFGKNRRLIPPNFIIYRDSSGLLRVETKLISTGDGDFFRRPILLPDRNELVFKLIEETHRTYSHVGVQTLVTTLREKYWILRSRKTVRSVVSKCVICQRFKSKSATTMFAPLPEERVRISAVFETTGVDLAGPLVLRNRDKVWIAIFTCAVYRAVHFELVSDISTQSFLETIHFTSRSSKINLFR
ncbi:uncharacterized protein [Parasteatoda tepidariorum]|uniref:uncharacterized protein n=1 Tax=Parasteatoda tepidariorum TaxID=114398 RepID=UPI0039BD65BE